MLPVKRPNASIADTPAAWNRINAAAIEPVINKAAHSPVSILVLSDIGPRTNEPMVIATRALGNAGCPSNIPNAAPSNAICISANRMVVRFSVTTTTPSSENVAPTTTDVISALWNIG